jgi:predicted AAA+ superfamily ATPase
MEYKKRLLEAKMRAALKRGKSVLLLGARQTGKSTLAGRFEHVLRLNFMNAGVMRKYSARPELLGQEIEALPRIPGVLPLVFLDEIQRLPVCLDVAQDLIDRHLAQFVLSGSSARQLRRGPKVNLLPGRVAWLHLDPFAFAENPEVPLEQQLLDGSLPAIAAQSDPTQIDDDLNDYVASYLQEEIRAEAAVRNLGDFSRFLELAGIESGQIVNYSKIAEDIGVKLNTIKAYFEILEDCLMVERIEPISTSLTRKKLTRSPRHLLFDMGVRRVCAREGREVTPERWGQLFEHWVGLELCRHARLLGHSPQILFWRDPDGPEVDFVIKRPTGLVPIEVKWDTAPNRSAAKHLKVFMKEHPEARQAFVICRASRPLKIEDNITALPWQQLSKVWAEDANLSGI